MKFRRTLTLLLVLCLWSEFTIACMRRPETPYTPYQNLIDRTRTIVWAIVEDVKRTGTHWEAEYTLKPIETLRGGIAAPFYIEGWYIWDAPELGEDEGTDETFHNHHDAKFWASDSGRIRTGPSCSVTPRFEVGGRYLVFLDSDFHSKGLERVESENDLWLQVVRLMAAER